MHCTFNTTGNMKNFVLTSTILILFHKLKSEQILNISSNIDSTAIADHIFKMLGLQKFCE